LAIILLAINLIFAPHNPYQEKSSTFECGFHSFLGQNRTQFSISFFIYALLFLLFDLELLVIYPYVVSSYNNEGYGLSIMIIFFSILTSGFAFELGKKALNIDSRQYNQKSALHSSSNVFISPITEYIKNFNLIRMVRGFIKLRMVTMIIPLFLFNIGIININQFTTVWANVIFCFVMVSLIVTPWEKKLNFVVSVILNSMILGFIIYSVISYMMGFVFFQDAYMFISIIFPIFLENSIIMFGNEEPNYGNDNQSNYHGGPNKGPGGPNRGPSDEEVIAAAFVFSNQFLNEGTEVKALEDNPYEVRSPENASYRNGKYLFKIWWRDEFKPMIENENQCDILDPQRVKLHKGLIKFYSVHIIYDDSPQMLELAWQLYLGSGKAFEYKDYNWEEADEMMKRDLMYMNKYMNYEKKDWDTGGYMKKLNDKYQNSKGQGNMEELKAALLSKKGTRDVGSIIKKIEENGETISDKFKKPPFKDW
jgi:NADH-ubiquinone oxidoreductase chain 3